MNAGKDEASRHVKSCEDYFKHILLAMRNIDKNVALRTGIKVCTGISYVVFRRIRLQVGIDPCRFCGIDEEHILFGKLPFHVAVSITTKG